MKQINYKKRYTKSVLCDTSGWSNVELPYTYILLSWQHPNRPQVHGWHTPLHYLLRQIKLSDYFSTVQYPSSFHRSLYPSRWLVVLWQLCEADLNSSQSSDEFNLELNQIILPCHHKIPPNSSACLQHVSIARYEILIYHCNPHRLHNSSTYLAALILTLQTNGVVPTQVLLSEN